MFWGDGVFGGLGLVKDTRSFAGLGLLEMAVSSLDCTGFARTTSALDSGTSCLTGLCFFVLVVLVSEADLLLFVVFFVSSGVLAGELFDALKDTGRAPGFNKTGSLEIAGCLRKTDSSEMKAPPMKPDCLEYMGFTAASDSDDSDDTDDADDADAEDKEDAVKEG
mmetsp:Transcript_21559/g.38115  ORF Transcript_21559/g.38115 Transcript_21559/m.38115 type:complete len:165 (+) Transcript_21559:460-954(+)